jgi:hypothetical protein
MLERSEKMKKRAAAEKKTSGEDAASKKRPAAAGEKTGGEDGPAPMKRRN